MSDDLIASMPFAAGLGIRLETAGAHETVAVLPWSDAHTTVGGLLHGGALMTLADTAGAVCAFLGLPAGARTATTQSGTHLLRAVSGSSGSSGGEVRATARPVHSGRSQIVVQTDVTDDRGRLVARTTQTQAVLPA
ncbi:PaaI family thioesterase [Actinomycetospora callitridis]|uniref:PaaI family thioesterase n=1 Tax=Actinomycetospora callitridis TaxID=913944 RepID=UPI00236715F6|nr:PaaI family thioesterase [Actinomycetospora callitridis]MDD7916736.1 PaaI family thioesterase [Actinomycetospora callitridis]